MHTPCMDSATPTPASTHSVTRRVSPAGKERIRGFEKFVPRVYLCPVGRRTIGYGHALRPFEHFPGAITMAEGERLMDEDLAPIEIYLNGVFPDLTQNEFDALASLIFNIGLGAFEKSTLFARLKAGDAHGAASQFERWVYGGGKNLPGLVRRRAIERDVFLSPEAKPWAP